jgi:hypothetical protein
VASNLNPKAPQPKSNPSRKLNLLRKVEKPEAERRESRRIPKRRRLRTSKILSRQLFLRKR